MMKKAKTFSYRANESIRVRAHAFAIGVKANVAVILALCLLPVALVAGFAIDHNRHTSGQSEVQHALDFAALATARRIVEADIKGAEVNTVAQSFFSAQFLPGRNMTLQPVTAARLDNQVVLSVSGEMPTTMMKIMGRQELPLGAKSTVVYGKTTPAEVVMVLDTSASMSGSRLTQLKSSASSLADTLLPSNVPGENDPVKLAIVPFNTYVNVGTGRKGESWIEVEDKYTTESDYCRVTDAAYGKYCTRESYTCYRDGIEKTCKRWNCPEGVELEKKCSKVKRKFEWHGCVASRDDPLNIEDRSYLSHKVDGFATSWKNACPSAILPLTNNQAKAKLAISNLAARNETYVATGLTWGLRTLTPGAPFTEGEDFTTFADNGGRKVLILMSDGANTKSPNSDGKHTNSDVDGANGITSQVCDEIKSYDIELYTIAFEITEDDTKAVLENCAFQSDAYYDASSASELQAAFDSIGGKLRDIALAS